MSEIKVNKIQPAAGDRIVVAAPIQGADAPSDCPDCLATLRQVGGGGSVGVSQAYVDEKDDATLLAAKQYSDEQNELQNNQLTLDINAAKTEAINSANAHSDANDSDTLLSANAYTDSKISGIQATNLAGRVGQVIPILTWGAGIGSATVKRNHTVPIPSGTWFVNLRGNSDSSLDSENANFSMAQIWDVPTGKWLVFAHSNLYTTNASSSESGLAWKLVDDPDPYRNAANNFPYTVIADPDNEWTKISKDNNTAQLINEQNADTATGGNHSASGCVYQGGGGWYIVAQVSGYAMRIA